MYFYGQRPYKKEVFADSTMYFGRKNKYKLIKWSALLVCEPEHIS